MTSKDVFFGKKTQKTNGKYGFKLIETRKNGALGHNFDNRWRGLRGKIQELHGTAWIFHQIHRGFLYIFHQCPFNIFDEVRVKKRGNPSKSRSRMWLKPNTVKVILTAIGAVETCGNHLGGCIQRKLAQVVFLLLSGNQAHGKASFSANSPRHVGKKWPHRPMFHCRTGINNINENICQNVSIKIKHYLNIVCKACGIKHVRCNLDVCPELMSRFPDFDPS